MSSQDEHDDEPLFEELEAPHSLDGLVISWESDAKGDFDGSTIRFDATHTSPLRWHKEIQPLKELKKQRKKCLAHLDLGLFSDLRMPLTNKTQFLSLGLAENHFVETIATPYQNEIVAVALFGGDVFNAHEIQRAAHEESYALWKQEYYPAAEGDLFSYYVVDHIFEFLHLVANMLPRRLPAVILIDTKEAISYTLYSKILLAARKHGLTIAYKDPLFAAGNGVFQRGHDFGFYVGDTPLALPESQQITTAIAIDEAKVGFLESCLNPLIARLLQEKTPFKILSEESMTTEWHEIEKLYIPQQSLDNPMTRRKVQGFIAAQGEVISF